jgi:hypothetical protein
MSREGQMIHDESQFKTIVSNVIVDGSIFVVSIFLGNGSGSPGFIKPVYHIATLSFSFYSFIVIALFLRVTFSWSRPESI